MRLGLRPIRGVLLLLSWLMPSSMCYAQSTPDTPVKEWPKEYRGAWFAGQSCDEVTNYIGITSKYKATGFLAPNNEGKFLISLRDSSDEIVTADSYGVLTTMKILDPLTKNSTDQIRANRIAGDIWTQEYTQVYADKPKEQKALTFHRCQTVTFKGRPIEVYDMFYRYLAYFAEQYQAISDHCGRPAKPSGKDCVNAITKVADLNGDGKIAPAEIAKLVRDLSILTVFFNVSPGDPKSYAIYLTLDAIRASQAASILLGPWVSGLLMANLDYDGNGVITPDELALTLGSGSSASSADWTRLFEQSKEQLSSLMPVLTGLSQFLGLGAAARR